MSSFFQVADFHLDCLECNRLRVYKCFFLIDPLFFFVDVCPLRFDFVLIFFSTKLLSVGLLMSTCSSDFLFAIVMR